MKYILLIITVIACCYAAYCTYQRNVYEQALIMIVCSTYKPKNDEDCARIVEEILNEFNKVENSNNE